MKFDINKINRFVQGADTDSSIFSLEPILAKMGVLDQTDDEIKEHVRKIQKNIGEKINKYQDNIAKNCFNCNTHYFDMKPEYIIKSTYWSNKRRYAQLIIDREGMPIEEYDIKGIDIYKSNFAPYFKTFGEQLLKDILNSKPKQEIDKNILQFKNSISTVDWKLLIKPSGLKKIDEYIDSPPRSGEMFSRLKIKCPQNTRAAIITNDLLRFYNLNQQYPCFVIGDKINVIILKNNPYKIDVIGLNGFNDAPQILKIAEQYIDKEGLFDSIIRNKLQTIYDDLGWELNTNTHISKFSIFEI